MEMGKNVNTDQTSKKNLYVKFINDNVDEAMLKKEFEQFGRVTSVKIQIENVKKDDKEYTVHRG
jgi:RNA recognition motif-containing protein